MVATNLGAGGPPPGGKLPCTILSGFLGSGKTTLLTHILRNKEGLRCAVIVNDMAELNIDASLVKNAALVQTEERLVEMSNGCICCTLREDLVVEVARLAAAGCYDYCVIESTGIGEPMQVAETFTLPVAEGGPTLQDIARLDTTVTVVDAANLMANFASVDSLRDRGEQADEEDERGVAELLLDQIEFADVILLNKVDLVSAEEQQRLLGLLRTLNPAADIVPTQQSQVPLSRVINTGRFSMEKAAQSPGWLKTLQEGFTPETEEYGIGNFVYRARRPFHPARLHTFLTTHFVVQEPDWSEALAAEQQADPTLHHSHDTRSRDTAAQPLLSGPAQQALQQASLASQQAAAALQSLVAHHTAAADTSGSLEQAILGTVVAAASAAAAASSAAALLLSQLHLGDTGGAVASPQGQQANGETYHHSHHIHNHQQHEPAVSSEEAQRRQALLTASYGQLLRSKGFVWLATRHDLCGEWSQAGGILRLGVGGPWYAALPDEAWPQDEVQRQAVLKDFQEPHGDRRQELVLIGVGLNREALTAALDACLCSDAEVAVAAGQLEDPFAEWPTLEQILGGGEDGEDGGTDQGDGQQEEQLESGARGLQPGSVHSVVGGAAELQECFNMLASQPRAGQGGGPALAAVSWHADWCSPCHEAAAVQEQLAAQHPDVAFFMLDVEASSANTAFALEKVMRKPDSRRAGARLVLKSGGKLPCITLHYLPSLQPVRTLAGSSALQELRQALQEHGGAGNKQFTAAVPAAPLAASNGIAQPVAAAATTAEPGTLVVLRRGAAEAKELLTAGKASSTPVIVVWTSSSARDNLAAASEQELRAAAAQVVARHSGVTVVDADAAASKANELLAGALKVKSYPEVHVYRGMKLDTKLAGSSATAAELLQLAAQLAPSRGAATALGTGPSSSAAEPSGPVVAALPVLPTAAAPCAGGVYDPPAGKFAKPGATKRFPDGRLGFFFPKMPCLRCGCPWWSSEDWDARCLRCAWDCESGGYDDDSQPLPKHRAKWQQYTEAIRSGRTPAWAG